jgi:hypothetical protein
MLTEHPDIEKRLREEIFKFVGPTATPTYDNMRDMKYTRAFLNGKYQVVYYFPFNMFTYVCLEVLRMYPPVCVCWLLYPSILDMHSHLLYIPKPIRFKVGICFDRMRIIMRYKTYD